MHNFEIKNMLSDDEIKEFFRFYEAHFIEIYGKDAVENAYFKWCELRQEKKKGRTFIKLTKEDKCLGYAELQIRKDKSLYFCDIATAKESRASRLIFEFVKFVLGCDKFKNYDEIYMHINHKNSVSLRTWSRFGLEKVEEGESSHQYKIKRENVEKYFERFNKNNQNVLKI